MTRTPISEATFKEAKYFKPSAFVVPLHVSTQLETELNGLRQAYNECMEERIADDRAIKQLEQAIRQTENDPDARANYWKTQHDAILRSLINSDLFKLAEKMAVRLAYHCARTKNDSSEEVLADYIAMKINSGITGSTKSK